MAACATAQADRTTEEVAGLLLCRAAALAATPAPRLLLAPKALNVTAADDACSSCTSAGTTAGAGSYVRTERARADPVQLRKRRPRQPAAALRRLPDTAVRAVED